MAETKTLTIRQLLTDPKRVTLISGLLPDTCDTREETAKRLKAVADLALLKTPALEQCTPITFFAALYRASEWGLPVDGWHAHLIPFGKVCTLIIDYKGFVNLAYRTGLVSRIHADLVCMNDEFAYSLGEVTKHSYDIRKDRGVVVGAYCMVHLKAGGIRCELMSTDEIDKIRATSKAAKNGPWVTHWGEMAKKTVFKRLAKWLPLGEQFVAVLDYDAEQDRKQMVEGTVDGTVERSIDLGTLTEMLQHKQVRGSQAKREPELMPDLAEEEPPAPEPPAPEPPTRNTTDPLYPTTAEEAETFTLSAEESQEEPTVLQRALKAIKHVKTLEGLQRIDAQMADEPSMSIQDEAAYSAAWKSKFDRLAGNDAGVRESEAGK